MESLWPWIGFHVFVLLAIGIDLGFFHKKSEQVSVRDSLIWSGVWVSVAVVFAAGSYIWRGPVHGIEFLTAYLIEWLLSVDNLFVFLTIFSAFAVPQKYQPRVLFWGIIGALVMRATFIFAGISLIARFHWIVYILGGFLIITGIKLMCSDESATIDPKNHWFMRAARRFLPILDPHIEDAGRFFVRVGGKTYVTQLFLVLMLIEIVDLAFATDSVPAVLGVTQDRFTAYTSNIFAILGLRSLYFAIAGMLKAFRFMRVGVSLILVFVGLKICGDHVYRVSPVVSLAVIVAILATSILASLWLPHKEAAEGSDVKGQ